MPSGRKSIRRGTEYEGVAEVGPGFQSIPALKPRGMTNAGSGTPDVDLPFPDPDFGSIILSPLDSRAVTENVAGSAVSLLELSTIDANLTTLGVSFPGADGDDNNTQWEVPVPSGMSPSAPNIQIRLHIVIAS